MTDTKLTNRQKEILTLVNKGYCIPREIAEKLKINKSNVSTNLKYLLDNNFVIRKKFFCTYIYAQSSVILPLITEKKRKCYEKIMKQEKRIFSARYF